LTSDRVLLVHIFNVLQQMSWQLGGDEKAPKPRPLVLPGMVAPDSGAQSFGSDPIPLAEFHDWWDGQGTDDVGGARGEADDGVHRVDPVDGGVGDGDRAGADPVGIVSG